MGGKHGPSHDPARSFGAGSPISDEDLPLRGLPEAVRYHPALVSNHGRHLLWLLDSASTPEQWNIALGALVTSLMEAAEPRVRPSPAASGAWRRQREVMQAAIARGFVAAPGRPRDRWRERSDAFMLLASVNGLTFNDAVKALAHGAGVKPGEARKRLMKVEKIVGRSLARQPKGWKKPGG